MTKWINANGFPVEIDEYGMWITNYDFEWIPDNPVFPCINSLKCDNCRKYCNCGELVFEV